MASLSSGAGSASLSPLLTELCVTLLSIGVGFASFLPLSGEQCMTLLFIGVGSVTLLLSRIVAIVLAVASMKRYVKKHSVRVVLVVIFLRFCPMFRRFFPKAVSLRFFPVKKVFRIINKFNVKVVP